MSAREKKCFDDRGEETEKITARGGSIEKKTEGEYLCQMVAFDNRQEKEHRERKKKV